MAVHILDAMSRGGFEQVHAIHDSASGLRAFVGLHNTSRGPAFGGIRRWAYRDERDALLDCLRLGKAMTHKCALAELPVGGAKVVIMDREGLDLEGAYRHLGRLVDHHQGRLYVGPDVGTSTEQLGWVAEETAFAAGPGASGPGQIAESTSAGVFHSMAAALQHMDGAVDWDRRTVVIQGLGKVGSLLAQRLVEMGVTVIATDIDPQRAEQVGATCDLKLVDASEVIDLPCDIFSPCALGGILHDLTLERLKCRAVVGAANNVLARSHHGTLLHERGILYVPDIVASAGALIRGVRFHLDGERVPVEEIGRRVGKTVSAVLAQAAEEGEAPSVVAVREAEKRCD
ncbi:MAG: glutamate dehydrogenase/leucine dehydrogenase [Chlamydiales bacterium]|jgi:glutamate dehydrogenase/leucine dehydrogenase